MFMFKLLFYKKVKGRQIWRLAIAKPKLPSPKKPESKFDIIISY